MFAHFRQVLVVACAAGALNGLATADALNANLFVDAKAQGTQSGLDWKNAMLTPQDAIDYANTVLTGNVHIAVAEGTYFPTTGQWNVPNTTYTARDTTIVLKSSSNGGNVFLHGGFKGCNDGNCLSPGTTLHDSPDGSFDRTILSGDIPGPADYHHVLVADGDQNLGYLFGRAIVDGFKVVGGLADVAALGRDDGAGIHCRNGYDVRLEHITFEGNVAANNGGAIFSEGGNGAHLEIAHATVLENIAKRGGGAYFVRTPAVEMANVHFLENGNQLQAVGGFPPVTVSGGGVHIDAEVFLECQNALFHDNFAEGGGAVYVQPDLDVAPTDYRHFWRNCTFAYNAVSSTGVPVRGGGFEVAAGPATGPPTGPDDDVFFYNCIFWRNGIGVDILLGANINAFVWNTNWDQNTVASAGTFNQVADTTGDPKFKNTAARNLRLKLSSPLIDAGNTALIGLDILDVDENGNFAEALPWDLDLGTRVNGAAVDMGAYETTSGQ
jgi:predicted outer membrane repeat protein